MVRVPQSLRGLFKHVLDGNRCEKLARPISDQEGRTIIPSGDRNQEKVGLRLDSDGTITKAGVEYNKFQLQANAGKNVPPEVKRLRELAGKEGGTHAVLGTALVKVDGDKDDVEKALEDLGKDVTERFG
jgi:hypothetical protein